MKFQMRCPTCKRIYPDVEGRIGEQVTFQCPTCDTSTVRHFGKESIPVTNFGEREWSDRISQFQFRNL